MLTRDMNACSDGPTLCVLGAQVTEHQDMKLMLSKARIIDELEATMPRYYS